MSKFALGAVCKTPKHFYLKSVKETNSREVRKSTWIIDDFMEEKLTALLARTLILGRGMKPVKLARATTPIGKIECGSKPKTA